MFLLSLKQMGEEGDVISVPYFHELQWVSSANAVTRRLLLDVINSAVGIEQLVYLYAKVCMHEITMSIELIPIYGIDQRF